MMTHNASNGASFEHHRVHTITHHDKDAIYTGIKIRTRDGHVIKLTRHHFMLVCRSLEINEGDPALLLSECVLTPAQNVSIGDHLVTVSSTTAGEGMEILKHFSCVEAVTEETMHGLFNLHAGVSSEPLIVVNGVLVSERTDHEHGEFGGLSNDEQTGLLMLSHAASAFLPSAVKSRMDTKFAKFDVFASLSDDKKLVVKNIGRNVHKLSVSGSKRVTFTALFQNYYTLFRHVIFG